MTGSEQRTELVRQLDKHGRRLGLASTMRNHACADLLELHSTDWACLDVLDTEGSLPIGTLGRQLGLSPAAATDLVDRLEARGLVRRTADRDDRRRVRVEATSARGARYDEIERQLIDAMAQHTDGFTERELETVVRFMQGAKEVLDTLARELRRTHAGAAM